MNSRVARIDTGVSVSFIVSAVIHLAVFLLLVWTGQLLPSPAIIQETYYVDVVNLPTAHPQAGPTAVKSGEVEPMVAPSPAPPLLTPKASLPVLKTPVKPVKIAAPQEAAVSESAFAERMAKLGEKAEAQQYEEKLKKLGSSKKTGGGTKVGMPGASDAEAGSRYADYIKSRLEDALKATSSYTTKNPEVAVRLTITTDGRLSRMKIERSSGDAAFELAVRRAIDLASEKFTAPPNHTVFENGFVFKPKGISNGKLR